MTTNQEARHKSFRELGGSTLDYNGDFLSMVRATDIPGGSVNEAMISWLQIVTDSTATNINDLQAGLANLLGVDSFNSIRGNIPAVLVNQGNLTDIATFTRASSATFFDVNGVLQTAANNVPRIDYLQDGSGLFGLRVEGARTNGALQSEDLTTTWINSATTDTANQATAPDGTVTMDELTSDEASSSHFISQNITVVNTLTYTTSVFAKKSVSDFVQITTSSGLFGVNVWANFDLNNGVVGSLGSATTSTMEHVGNGVYRCTITATATATGSAAAFAIALISSASATRLESFTSAASVYCWGMQLELGDFVSSYIATTVSTATRAADLENIDLTGVSWFNPLEGTIFVDFVMASDQSLQRIVSVDDGGTSDRIEIITLNNDQFQGTVRASSSTSTFRSTPTIDPIARHKLAFAFAGNDAVISIDGGVGSVDNTVTMPSGLITFRIGRDVQGLTPAFGIITNLRYYPTRLPDATLQSITT